LTLVTVPVGADTAGTSATGGSKGTGLLRVSNLSIGARGEAGDTVAVVFDVRLAPVITSGTVALNQAELVSPNVPKPTATIPMCPVTRIPPKH
jgi:hypothetical protein